MAKNNEIGSYTMSLAKASKMMGCSHTHLRMVLKGERKPSELLANKIRLVLGIKVG